MMQQMLPVTREASATVPHVPVETVSAAPAPPAAPLLAGFTYRCGTCQSEVGRTARFCQHCGAAL